VKIAVCLAATNPKGNSKESVPCEVDSNRLLTLFDPWKSNEEFRLNQFPGIQVQLARSRMASKNRMASVSEPICHMPL
jgi:hypothetical protein